MINGGKCPGCGQTVTRAVIENVNIGPLIGQVMYKGVSFSCPNMTCRHVFSVGIDPIALKSDIVSEVKSARR